MPESSMIIRLLEQVWQSPIFSDSYPPQRAFAPFAAKMEIVYRTFIPQFRAIIMSGMPEVNTSAIDMFVTHNAAKAAAFCTGIGVEIENIERLANISTCFGLLYWADSLLDHGDVALLQAISILDNSMESLHPAEPLVLARLAALQQIKPYLLQCTRPEDVPFLLLHPFLEFLRHSVTLQQLSREYRHSVDPVFWHSARSDFIKASIISIQLPGTVAAVYALYRQQQPALPALKVLASDARLMSPLECLGNAALRIFDDVGDQNDDAASDTFTLNLFNQAQTHPDLIPALLDAADITDPPTVTRLISAFSVNDPMGDAAVVATFVELLRQQITSLPPELWEQYGIYLRLAKRLIECGYVNCIGDSALLENPIP
jgi:hypothetical protein